MFKNRHKIAIESSNIAIYHKLYMTLCLLPSLGLKNPTAILVSAFSLANRNRVSTGWCYSFSRTDSLPVSKCQLRASMPPFLLMCRLFLARDSPHAHIRHWSYLVADKSSAFSVCFDSCSSAGGRSLASIAFIGESRTFLPLNTHPSIRLRFSRDFLSALALFCWGCNACSIILGWDRENCPTLVVF